MSEPINTGGPAFPWEDSKETTGLPSPHPGMTLRDWFAGMVQADDRLVKCVRAMDDVALEIFAKYPQVEQEEWITETGPLEGATKWHGMTEVQKVAARLELEAKAIARVRFMQADAMLAERSKGGAQ